MSDKIANTQDRPEEKPLTEQELHFCNLGRTAEKMLCGGIR